MYASGIASKYASAKKGQIAKSDSFDWDHLLSVALGELGLSESEFWNMAPRVFYNVQDGYWRKWERDQRAEWERARWMATVIINPHLKKGIQPQKLMRFPWEKAEPLTKEEINKVANRLGKHIN